MRPLGLNLYKVIKKKGGKLSLYTIYGITIQIIERLRVLHSYGFVHNDLKPDNIMIG